MIRMMDDKTEQSEERFWRAFLSFSDSSAYCIFFEIPFLFSCFFLLVFDRLVRLRGRVGGAEGEVVGRI